MWYSIINVIATIEVTALVLAAGLVRCNVFVLFVLFFLCGMSMICLAFTVTPLLTRSRLVINVVPTLICATSFLALAIFNLRNDSSAEEPVSDVPAVFQHLLGLCAPVAFVLGIDKVSVYLSLVHLFKAA